MGRAERRHHDARIKDRVRRMMIVWGEWSLSKDLRFVGRYAATPHPCSCPMCGNRRRYEGPTYAERTGAGIASPHARP